ncbi:transmembrane and coiled-coil domain protein 3-like isoform X1 [Petromyzon marinus]|uniref:Transmembrane and coiled-coil domain protein 3-like isoform X1 n=1 Tax=Petromyzon marinus TaxID=7757 RepID=A0AAJ7TMA4_PETMA|nr:transmembrane and coiled-coil domain protein 3-like isoform X1 [Petromyzon marinus]XP_032819183.1 transmembrane and coiled-coil domain protein 3-like isoform X1 [Petromyzon marinus]
MKRFRSAELGHGGEGLPGGPYTAAGSEAAGGAGSVTTAAAAIGALGSSGAGGSAASGGKAAASGGGGGGPAGATMFGQGFKQLFQPRKRSKDRGVTPTQTPILETPSQAQAQATGPGLAEASPLTRRGIGFAPGSGSDSQQHLLQQSDCEESDERSERDGSAVPSTADEDTAGTQDRQTAFNRVLQQMRPRGSGTGKRGSGPSQLDPAPLPPPPPPPPAAAALTAAITTTTTTTAALAQPTATSVVRPSPQQHRKAESLPREHSGGVGLRPRSASATEPALAHPPLGPPMDPDEGGGFEQHERLDASSLALPAVLVASAGSDVSVASDTPDGLLFGSVGNSSGPPDPQKTRATIESLQQKILRFTEQIRVEQHACDENVAEYLKLASNTDRQQALRIKAVFEKKNQRSLNSISQLQRKLELYHRRLREAEQNGVARQPKDVLRDVQQGLRDVSANVRAGISGFGGGVVDRARGLSKPPREIATIIRSKFGSADNIATFKEHADQHRSVEASRTLSGSATLVSCPKYSDDDDCSSGGTSGAGSALGLAIVSTSLGRNLTGSSATAGGNGDGGGGGNNGGTELGSPRYSSYEGLGMEAIRRELHTIHSTHARLEGMVQEMRTQFQTEVTNFKQSLLEERFRFGRLEDQLNDLTELHQNEMSNLKQELASMEEKVAYQSYERARDVQEALEGCQTRISKLELQQQQQQVVQLEGLENANARALLGKLINVLLALMAVVLVFVSTAANFITPLVRTRNRILVTALLTVMLAYLWKNWDGMPGLRTSAPPNHSKEGPSLAL